MKKSLFTIAIMAILCINACTNPTTKTTKGEVLKASIETVNKMAETEKAIEVALDKIKASVDNKDIVSFKAAYTDNSLIYGTAPEEAPFEAGAVLQVMESIFASNEISYKYSVLERDILVQPDGKTAIAVEQGKSDLLSKNMQFRTVFHFIQSNGKWLVNFQSIAMIPENKDLKTLDAALE